MEDREQRLVESVQAVLLGAKNRSLGITALNKALFYADLMALCEFGRVLSDATFVALERGPVVEDYPRTLVALVESQGIAEQTVGEELAMEKPVRLLVEPSFNSLDEDEREIALEVGKWASKYSGNRLSDFAHQNPGWRIAWEAGRAKGLRAVKINMLIAMQQLAALAPPDAWLKEPVDEVLGRALANVTAASGRPWE